MAKQRGLAAGQEGSTAWMEEPYLSTTRTIGTSLYMTSREIQCFSRRKQSVLSGTCLLLPLPASLFPPLSFFVLAQDRDSGVRGQACQEGQVPCFGQDPNIWLQGRHVSYRAVAGASHGHYISTLQTDFSCTFLP